MSHLEESLSRRSERIALRVDPQADSVLRRAASVEHKSLSAFMLESALEHAYKVIEEEQRLVLKAEEFERVMAELDRPAQVVEPLLKLAEKVARQSSRELM